MIQTHILKLGKYIIISMFSQTGLLLSTFAKQLGNSFCRHFLNIFVDTTKFFVSKNNQNDSGVWTRPKDARKVSWN